MAVSYSYVGSGSLSLQKCGYWFFFDPHYTRPIAFSVRDQAWLRYKAEKGILESIIIKKIKLFDYTFRGTGLAIITYTDTFNTVYNERDLIYYSEAVTLAEAYLYRQRVEESQAECLR
jgi:hypothetical protein